MIPKKMRLSTKVFDETYKKGQSFSTPFFIMRFIGRDMAEHFSTLSCVVPKSVEKTAQKRNTLRRKGYASMEKYLPLFKKPYTMILIFKKEAKSIPYSTLDTEIGSFLKKHSFI